MTVTTRSASGALVSLVAVLCVGSLALVDAQRGGRGGGRGFGPGAGQDINLPENPVAVAIPAITSEVTGPGASYESVQSLPPGRDLAHYGYEAREYFVTGTAAGEPYKTRVVVRKPRDNARFSGLVLAEAMHPSGSAHLFEYTSDYLMSSGHAAVEIVTGGLQQFPEHNAARYGDLSVAPGQVSEILAQVGALMKQPSGSPLSALPVRKMILAGTSATAGVLIRYLPAHRVYRRPGMAPVYDGFLPHATGAMVPAVDAPLIQIPTMTEVASGNVTARQDGDAPGDQFRLYEFAGMAHVDTRDSVRFQPDPCRDPVMSFPLQAYVSVALDHLLAWVDTGTVPPRAPRILIDRDATNDGSLMALDERGNAVGGIRNPYVDVPTAQYGVRNTGADPLIPNPSAYIAAGGLAAANQMCGLAGYQKAITTQQLRSLYADKAGYQQKVRARLDELERAGWSLPVYRTMILADAAAVTF